jgi:hypothetical protein
MYSQHQIYDAAGKIFAPSFVDSSPVRVMVLFGYYQLHRKSFLSLLVNRTFTRQA